MNADEKNDLAASLSFGKSLVARGPSRGEFVYKALLDAIRSGQIKSGDRIREEDIAQLLGVSRTPVREALQLLQARRLVEMVSGRGIVVVELNTQQVMEYYAMREVLEGAAARFAAQHASSAELGVMRELLDEFTEAIGEPLRLERINNAFHRTIAQAARNRYMQEALNNLEDALSLLRNTTFTLPERQVLSDREHRAIVAAIESRDSEGAEAAARLHTREAQRARARMLRQVP